MRRFHPVTLQQATMGTPNLARLVELGQESTRRLQAIEKLLPPMLRSSVTAGPIDGPVWCLLVRGNSVAAKLRQLLPALVAHLRTRGHEVTSIRLKVQTAQNTP
jgi:hypothetical protein